MTDAQLKLYAARERLSISKTLTRYTWLYLSLLTAFFVSLAGLLTLSLFEYPAFFYKVEFLFLLIGIGITLALYNRPFKKSKYRYLIFELEYQLYMNKGRGYEGLNAHQNFKRFMDEFDEDSDEEDIAKKVIDYTLRA